MSYINDIKKCIKNKEFPIYVVGDSVLFAMSGIKRNNEYIVDVYISHTDIGLSITDIYIDYKYGVPDNTYNCRRNRLQIVTKSAFHKERLKLQRKHNIRIFIPKEL